MNEDSGPRSPFAMSPSARPPAGDDARVIVRVPPPGGSPVQYLSTPAPYVGTPMYGQYGSAPPAPQAQIHPSQYPAPQAVDSQFVNAQTMLPGGQATGAPPVEQAKKRVSPVPIVAVLLAAGVAGGVIFFGKSDPARAPAAAPAIPPASAAATAPAPPAPPSAPPYAGPQIIADTVPAPVAFDAVAAAHAIDAVVPTAAQCKLPKGRVCKVKVSFDPTDGKVHKAEALAPCHGTPPEKCVVGGVKKASMAPFAGAKPGSITYSFPPKKK